VYVRRTIRSTVCTYKTPFTVPIVTSPSDVHSRSREKRGPLYNFVAIHHLQAVTTGGDRTFRFESSHHGHKAAANYLASEPVTVAAGREKGRDEKEGELRKKNKPGCARRGSEASTQKKPHKTRILRGYSQDEPQP
jgi:hypothetical protein